MPKEQKKLSYKIAGGFGETETLQSALMAALEKCTKIQDRIEEYDEAAKQVRFINLTLPYNGMIFGNFHKVTKDLALMIIDMVEENPNFSVTAYKAKTDNRPNGEFIESTLQFGVYKNHVFLLQSSGLRSDQFEKYLNWILNELRPDGAEVKVIHLNDPVLPADRLAGKSPVKSIKLGSNLGAVPPKGTVEEVNNVKMSLTGRLLEGIRAIFSSHGAEFTEDELVKSVLDEPDVTATLELHCSRKAMQSSAGQFMAQLGHSLRHSTGDGITLELEDGSKIRGNDLKIGTHVSVECQNRHPLLLSVAVSMYEYLLQLIRSGRLIETDPIGSAR